VNREENSSVEDNVLRTRASTYKKVKDNTSHNGPVYGVSPVGWDVIE